MSFRRAPVGAGSGSGAGATFCVGAWWSPCFPMPQRHLGCRWGIFWTAALGSSVSYSKLRWLVIASQRGWICLITPFSLFLCITQNSFQLMEVLLIAELGAEVTWHQTLKGMLKDAERHITVFPNYLILENSHLFSNYFWHQWALVVLSASPGV